MHYVERALRPHRWFEAEQGGDERVEARGNVCDDVRRRERLRRPHFRKLREVARRVSMATREREVERRAEREEICPAVQPRPVHDLGRHEGGRADDEGALAHGHHRAEIDELGPAVTRAADVARTDVAMHQPSRMNERERGADLVRECAGLTPRHGREVAQVAAVEQLHRVVRALGVEPVIVDLDDARVRELRERVKLALEQRCGGLSVPRSTRRNELLERHLPPLHAVRCTVHDGHPPSTQHLVDLVPTADSKRQCGPIRRCFCSAHSSSGAASRRRPTRQYTDDSDGRHAASNVASSHTGEGASYTRATAGTTAPADHLGPLLSSIPNAQTESANERRLMRCPSTVIRSRTA